LCRAAEAIEFYKNAFGRPRAQPDAGLGWESDARQHPDRDSVLDAQRRNAEWGSFGAKHFNGSPVTIHLYVENADAVFEQAVRAGAKVTMPLADMFWGDRYGKVEDPFGHQWSIAPRSGMSVPRRCKKAMEQMGS